MTVIPRPNVEQHPQLATTTPVTPGLCEAKQPLTLGGWVLCGVKTVIRYRHTCVHEHVVDGFVCGLHIPVEGEVGCRQCWDAGHECPMFFERLPDLELTS